jgi:ribosomal protein L19E
VRTQIPNVAAAAASRGLLRVETSHCTQGKVISNVHSAQRELQWGRRTRGWQLGGLNTLRNSSTVQWNQRMRKMRRERPCVSSTSESCALKRPALMSRTMWSSKIVILQ